MTLAEACEKGLINVDMKGPPVLLRGYRGHEKETTVLAVIRSSVEIWVALSRKRSPLAVFKAHDHSVYTQKAGHSTDGIDMNRWSWFKYPTATADDVDNALDILKDSEKSDLTAGWVDWSQMAGIRARKIGKEPAKVATIYCSEKALYGNVKGMKINKGSLYSWHEYTTEATLYKYGDRHPSYRLYEGARRRFSGQVTTTRSRGALYGIDRSLAVLRGAKSSRGAELMDGEKEAYAIQKRYEYQSNITIGDVKVEFEEGFDESAITDALREVEVRALSSAFSSKEVIVPYKIRYKKVSNASNMIEGLSDERLFITDVGGYDAQER